MPNMSEWWQFVYIAGTGLTGCIIGTYLTAPTARNVLEHFYKTTRPFGFWKPLKSVLSPDQRIATEKEHRNDLSALPFSLVWQVSVLLLPMQLMIKAYTAFFVTLGLFAISMAGLYVFWFKNLPKAAKATVVVNVEKS